MVTPTQTALRIADGIVAAFTVGIVSVTIAHVALTAITTQSLDRGHPDPVQLQAEDR